MERRKQRGRKNKTWDADVTGRKNKEAMEIFTIRQTLKFRWLSPSEQQEAETCKLLIPVWGISTQWCCLMEPFLLFGYFYSKPFACVCLCVCLVWFWVFEGLKNRTTEVSVFVWVRIRITLKFGSGTNFRIRRKRVCSVNDSPDDDRKTRLRLCLGMKHDFCHTVRWTFWDERRHVRTNFNNLHKTDK